MRHRARASLVALATACLMIGGSAGGAAAASPFIVHAPRHFLKPGHGHGGGGGTSLGWASSNWSGYAVTGSGITSVTGTWTVPSVSPSNGSTYSSAWIGIDGFNNSSLIQTGTEQDYYSGSTHYYAWWEILPAAETVITSITVRPGDLMDASITGGGSTWKISLTDKGNGESSTTYHAYSGPETSAEWILEAPSLGGHITTLADYSQAVFDPGTLDTSNPGLVPTDGGYMVQKRTIVSIPSLPDSDTDGFTVAYGSSQPSPPSS